MASIESLRKTLPFRGSLAPGGTTQSLVQLLWISFSGSRLAFSPAKARLQMLRVYRIMQRLAQLFLAGASRSFSCFAGQT